MHSMDDARHLFDRLPSPGKRLALGAAILVHGLLAVFLFYGVRWQDKAPVAVEVELVSRAPEPVVAPPPAAVKTTPKRVSPPPPKTALPKPDIALKDKPKKKPEPKPEIKPEPKPPVKYDPMKEMLRQEADQQKRNQMHDALAREEAHNKSSAQQAVDAAARSKGMAEYGDKIRAKIRGNIFAPPSATGNPEVEFVITQIQGADGGVITDVKLRKSSGQPALDEAVERAIRKSSPLPLPDRKDDFTRMVTLKLRPLEQTSPH